MAFPITSPSSDLHFLADGIRRAHTSCVEAFAKGLQHAIEAGTLLIRAKEQVQHGEWLAWLENHCNLSERAAQRYMQVAREFPKLEAIDPANTTRVADLSLRQALALVAENARTVQRVPEPERPAILERAAEAKTSILSDMEAEFRARRERQRREKRDHRRNKLECIERAEHAILHEEELPTPVLAQPESFGVGRGRSWPSSWRSCCGRHAGTRTWPSAFRRPTTYACQT